MKKGSWLALLLLAAALATALMFFQKAYLGAPVAGPVVKVEITEANASAVADVLARSGVISSAFWYRLYARVDGSATRPKSGTYELRPGTSLRQIARTLAIGPKRREVTITILEGWTMDDIAAKLMEEEGVKPEATRRAIGQTTDRAPFDPAYRIEFPFLKDLPKSRSLEGYLFPDTYRVWADQLPEALVGKQLEEFALRYGDAKVTEKSSPLKTLDQIVTLASIVEAEVRSADDRRMVAGIFLNRLRQGMALQSDATITYVTGSKRSRSTAADLQIDSPYNTYKNRGLPPGPIGNPGAQAMNAVLDPKESPYFYFLTDKEGKVLYAKTLEEHAANRQKAGY